MLSFGSSGSVGEGEGSFSIYLDRRRLATADRPAYRQSLAGQNVRPIFTRPVCWNSGPSGSLWNLACLF